MNSEHEKRHALDWPAMAGAQDDVWRETELRVRRKHRRRVQLAGVALVVLVAAGFGFRLTRTVPAVVPTVANSSSIVTAPTKQLLPDGSLVELKSGAVITVAFTDALRRVVLDRGEAHFQVAKNARPFVVAAHGVDVRAVGTAFAVQLLPQSVEVLVTEGRVAVDQSDAAQPMPRALDSGPQTLAMVDAGSRVSIDVSTDVAQLRTAKPSVIPVPDAEINARLAWRVPKLELSATPLSDVLPRISEFSGLQLRLDDATLGNVRLSGVLRADNVDTLLQLLESNHGIVVLRRTDRELVLGRR